MDYVIWITLYWVCAVGHQTRKNQMKFFFEELEVASHSQAMVVVERSQAPGVSCRDSTAGHEQLRNADYWKLQIDSFLAQVVEDSFAVSH